MRVAKVIVFLLLSAVTGKATDFLTEGVDNARTGWVRDEKVFTPANVGSMKLLWKLKLESKPRAMHNLFAPLVAERVTTANDFDTIDRDTYPGGMVLEYDEYKKSGKVMLGGVIISKPKN